MHDQAESLRQKLANANDKQLTKTISFISGKGGVGKSNIALNFALTLCQEDKKVLLIDFDIGMGNIDILMGRSTEISMIDMFEAGLPMSDIIQQGPNELDFISGGYGLTRIFELNQDNRDHFFREYDVMMQSYDFIIFDMGAGVTEDSLFFILASDECIVITTPEPTSITDGYSMIKHIVNNQPNMPIYIVMNRHMSETSGVETLKRFEKVVWKFLRKKITIIGNHPSDQTVQEAVLRQVPFILLNKRSAISRSMRTMVENYLNDKSIDSEPATLSFIQKLKGFIRKR